MSSDRRDALLGINAFAAAFTCSFATGGELLCGSAAAALVDDVPVSDKPPAPISTRAGSTHKECAQIILAGLLGGHRDLRS